MADGDLFSDLSIDPLSSGSSVREHGQKPTEAVPAKDRKRLQSSERDTEDDLPLAAEGEEHKIDRMA